MDFRLQKSKRYMGVEKYTMKVSELPGMVECNNLHEIETSISLMVQLKERLDTP